MKSLTTIMILMVLAISGHSATWYVPDDFSSIQGAISSGSVVNGDTVIVRPGTYMENLNFLGKAIVLKSQSGPDLTIIDGMRDESVVRFDSFEGPDSVLRGFTLTNGTGSLDPDSYYSGGGIYCLDSSPLITDNIITGNILDEGCGAGICLWSSSATITGNTVIYNGSWMGSGGGISCMDGSSATISNNEIIGNLAGDCGGGIDCYDSSPSIYNNLIIDNTAGDYTVAYGGGIHCSGSSSYPECTNCTICGNDAQGGSDSKGGGIAVTEGADVWISNTILWDNTAGISGPQLACMGWGLPGDCSVEYCCVQGGLAQVYDPYSVVMWDWGNIDPATGPMFVAGPRGNYYLSQIAAGDPADSPCLDADVTFPMMVNGTTRTDGIPDDDWMDMGYHYVEECSLIADSEWLSILGGSIDFSLDAGTFNAGRVYLLLGSMSGSNPGTVLPTPGGATLPLNWDAFTNFLLGSLNTNLFSNFMAVLDSQGKGNAQINAPAVSHNKLWKKMRFAYCLEGAPWDSASNPVQVMFGP